MTGNDSQFYMTPCRFGAAQKGIILTLSLIIEWQDTGDSNNQRLMASFTSRIPLRR